MVLIAPSVDWVIVAEAVCKYVVGKHHVSCESLPVGSHPLANCRIIQTTIDVHKMCVRIYQAAVEANRYEELWVRVFHNLSERCSFDLLDNIAVYIEERERGRVLVSCNVKTLIYRFNSDEIVAVVVEESENW